MLTWKNNLSTCLTDIPEYLVYALSEEIRTVHLEPGSSVVPQQPITDVQFTGGLALVADKNQLLLIQGSDPTLATIDLSSKTVNGFQMSEDIKKRE